MTQYPEECRECKFWACDPEDDEGSCRRYPPIFIAQDMQELNQIENHLAFFPRTVGSDWCGEYKHGGTKE